MTAEQLSALKQKIDQAAILSEQEKKEWLFLLPKMTDFQISELERLMSVKMPVSPVSPLHHREATKALLV